MSIDKVQQAGVRSGAFAAGITRESNVANVGRTIGQGGDTGSFLEGFLGVTIPKVMQYAQGEQAKATMQGQIDQNAGIIAEQSWWTKDAYDTGQNISKAMESTQAFALGSAGNIREGINNKLDIQEFTERSVQPYIAEIAEKVRSGEIPAENAAMLHKAAMQTAAGVQDAYAKAQQKQLIQESKQTMAAVQVRAVDLISNPTSDAALTPSVLSSALLDIRGSALDPDDGSVEQAVVQIISASTRRLDGTTPQGRENINQMRRFMASSEAAMLKPEATAKIDEMLNRKETEGNKLVEYNLNAKIDQAKFNLESGADIESDLAEIDSNRKEAMGLMALNPDQAEKIRAQIADLKLSALKKRNTEVDLTGDRAARDLSGTSDEKQTSGMVKKLAGQGVSPTEMPEALITLGTKWGNPTMVKEGYKRIGEDAAAVFTTEPSKLTDTALVPDTALMSATKLVGKVQDSIRTGSMGQAALALEGIPPKYRAAMEQWSANNTRPFNPVSDMPTIIKGVEALQNAELLKAGQAKVLPEDLNSSVLNSMFGKGTGINANYFEGASDVAKANMAMSLNIAAEANKAALYADGQQYPTAKSLVGAMYAKGLIMKTTNGVAVFPPMVKAAMDKAGATSPEYFQQAEKAMRVKLATAYGKGLNAEDIALRYNAGSNTLSYVDLSGAVPKVIGHPTGEDFAAGINSIREEARSKANLLPNTGKSTGQVAGLLGVAVSSPMMPDGYAKPYFVKVMGKDLPIPKEAGDLFANPVAGANIVGSIMQFEGYVDKPTATQKGNPVLTIGHGVATTFGQGVYDAMVAAPTPAAQQAIWVNKVLAPLAKNTLSAGQAVGLPAMSPDRVNPDVVAAYAGIANTQYHRPKDVAVYKNALQLAKFGKLAEAKTLISAMPSYKESQPDRQKLLNTGLDGMGRLFKTN